ncbi:unnamed protein product [Effrenium voratum]|nr:unnamed protein product [Effrenium voratum]
MEFPAKSLELKVAVERYSSGFEHGGRRYYFVSSSKADAYPHGPSAWLAAPPFGGSEQIDLALGFGKVFRLEKATAQIPNPTFRLRARVKQLFSSMIVYMEAVHLQIQVVPDFVDEQLIRDDGAGEADPEILEMLAAAAGGCETFGLNRLVGDSAQIRCSGLKGMLIASPRLKGSRKVEVPETMLKFGATDFSQECLSVLSFSRVRPTSLGLDVILRLEAAQCDMKALVQGHKRYLRRVSRMDGFRAGAFDGLYYDLHDEKTMTEPEIWSQKTYIGTHLELLLCGFDPHQHPLLEVILRQKEAALKKAMKHVHLRGCWSARGHPEPQGEGGSLELKDNEIFLMVPCDAEESGWRALTGEVIINYLSDRDPNSLRLAVAKDSEALRAKCAPGALFFSKKGRPLQVNLSWDFDGDYFQVITQEEVVSSFRGETAPGPLPRFKDPQLTDVVINSLVDVHAHFLLEYPPREEIGLHHWQWQMKAGEGPLAASSLEGRQTAAAYCKSLDVEKGKPLPKLGPYPNGPRWDFMNKKEGAQTVHSQTSAGECYRQAAKAFEEFQAAKAPGERGADADLMKAWKGLCDELGPPKCEAMKKLAARVRGDWAQNIRDGCNRAEREAGGNPNACMDEELRGEWLTHLQKRVQEEVERQNFTLTQLALAAWHMKYVDQGVSLEKKDPSPSFPWVLFREELLQWKEHGQGCPKRQLRKNHALLRKLQRNISEAMTDADKEAKVKEAIQGLRGHMKCQQCLDTRTKLLSDLHLGSWSAAAEAVRGIAGRGEVEEVDCEELRFAKAFISDTLEHGKQPGAKLQELVDQLVTGQESFRKLELTAVRFHGELYVVEGNHRLWCIKEAQRRLQKKLSVSVRVPNLYFGFIHRQEHKEPALPYFLQRFDPRFEGKEVEVQVLNNESPKATEHDSQLGTGASQQRPSCPKCGGGMVERANRSDGSKFLGCANYFASGCNGTRSLPDQTVGPPSLTSFQQPSPAAASPSCPKCGGGMVERANRSDGSKFLGCANYFASGCNGTRSLPDQTVGPPSSTSFQQPSPAAASPSCPKCGGGMVERANRSDGSKFLGCANYFASGCNGTRSLPDQTVGPPSLTSFQQPSPAAASPSCPKCGGGMVERANRSDGSKFLGCANYFASGCNGTRSLPDQTVGPPSSTSFQQPSPAAASPSCPKCGGGMVERANRSDGSKFLGCANYFASGCNGTRSLPDQTVGPPSSTPLTC